MRNQNALGGYQKVPETDNTYREALVDWELSTSLVKKAFAPNSEQILLTQGFIGSTINNLTTTLGREGSDYTAAILAYILDAESVTIWKDVPGVLNADPNGLITVYGSISFPTLMQLNWPITEPQ
jgi:aspartate kinase